MSVEFRVHSVAVEKKKKKTLDAPWKCHAVLLSVSFWGLLAKHRQRIKTGILCFMCKRILPLHLLVSHDLSNDFMEFYILAAIFTIMWSSVWFIIAISCHHCQLKSHLFTPLSPALSFADSMGKVTGCCGRVPVPPATSNSPPSSLRTWMHFPHSDRCITIFHNRSCILCTLLLSWIPRGVVEKYPRHQIYNAK